MKPMKPALVLRLALAWAALTGDYQQISLGTGPMGVSYRFDVSDRAVRRWLKRNEKRKTKAAAKVARREERSDGMA